MPASALFRAGVPAPYARAFLASTCTLLALVAVALHSPGHTSVDSSIQLHEAITGRIMSWAPPFMSALLYWLGLGSVGTALFVALNAGSTYGGMRLAIGTGGVGRIAWWKIAIALALVLNPVVFLYVGIVWKDVLLASLCSLSLGLTLAAWRHTGGMRIALAVAALVVLLPIPQVRQQGLLMLPLFAVSPGLLIVDAGWRTRRARIIAGAMVVIGLVLGHFAVRTAIESAFQKNATGSIYSAVGSDVSVGTRMIRMYDLVGIEARTPGGAQLKATGVDRESLAATVAMYTPERIDTLQGPPLDRTFGSLQGDRLADAWKDAVLEHPGAYLAHRWDVFSWLVGFHGEDRCLPIHVGTAGLPDFLKESGMREEQDARDSRLYTLLQPITRTLVWRHWFYVILGLVVATAAWRRGPSARRVLLPWVVGLAVFSAGYFPTSIACDFRYLYTLVPCSAILLLGLLLREPERRTA
ncbi:hypothetical protein [Lysobacter xanthus]